MKEKEIGELKRKYPEGMPIELLEMKGEAQMKPGLKGTVLLVDDIGQIHVAWENGSSLALNVEEDTFRIDKSPDQIRNDELSQRYCEAAFRIAAHTNLKRLHASCNGGEDRQYAQETLRKLQELFESVYGSGFVDPELDFVVMPAILRGRDTGKLAVGFVKLDIQSSGEHWGSIFLTDRGVIDDMGNTDPELKSYLHENFVPYDCWYLPMVERDHHVDFRNIPEEVKELAEGMLDGFSDQSFGMQME